MTQKRRGQPVYLGPRTMMALRVPDPVANEVRARAAARGVSTNRFVADIVAHAVGMPDLAHSAVYQRAKEKAATMST